MTVLSYLGACCKNPGIHKKNHKYELGKLNRISAALYKQTSEHLQIPIDKTILEDPDLLA